MGHPTGPMTLKQSLFTEAYLGAAKGNATEAARMAGYNGKDHTLHQMASENLRKPAIAAAVRDHLEQHGSTADRVIALLVEIAEMPIEDFKGMGKDAKATLGDKVRALELLGKYHKLWVDRSETTNTEIKRIEIRSIEVARPAQSVPAESRLLLDETTEPSA